MRSALFVAGLCLLPALAFAQGAPDAERAQRDSVKRVRDETDRVADSTRLANRVCLPGDVIMNVCRYADTVYADRKAVGIVRRPRTRGPADPRRVDTLYVERLPDPHAGLAADTVFVDRRRAGGRGAPKS